MYHRLRMVPKPLPSLGQLVSQLRVERGLSMEGLAAIAGLSQETISSIERDEPRRVRRSTGIQLFRAFMDSGNLEQDDAYKLLDCLGLSHDLYARYGSSRMVALQRAEEPDPGLISRLKALIANEGPEGAAAILDAAITRSRVSGKRPETPPPNEPPPLINVRHPPAPSPLGPGTIEETVTSYEQVPDETKSAVPSTGKPRSRKVD